MKFDPNSNPPSFASDDQVRIVKPPHTSCFNTILQIIEKNTKVRLKIVGTRVDATEIVGVIAFRNSGDLLLPLTARSLPLERSRRITLAS